MIRRPTVGSPMRFCVIVERGLQHQCFGPYRTFKRAEGDAKAWGGYVLRTLRPEDHAFPAQPEMTAEQETRVWERLSGRNDR